VSRITRRFNKLKKQGRAAFIPYIMAGDPSLDVTADTVRTLEKCGADIVELGVPFSDPLADGPVIQRAAERALRVGVSLRDVIALVGELRNSVRIPIVLMTYYNPVFKLGEEEFMRLAGEAGVDGLIVPDLPPEEARTFISHARANKIDTIFLLAPTSTAERRNVVVKSSRGFVYYVSLTGITGASLNLSAEQKADIEAIKNLSTKPVALGFGVKTPEQARSVAQIADGVIVGSEIVTRMHEGGDIKEFLNSLRAAIG
jgi:tryptophan synthase alpha chain